MRETEVINFTTKIFFPHRFKKKNIGHFYFFFLGSTGIELGASTMLGSALPLSFTLALLILR